LRISCIALKNEQSDVDAAYPAETTRSIGRVAGEARALIRAPAASKKIGVRFDH
jgi:hypothetical protein